MKKFLIALSVLAMGITSAQAQIAYEKAKPFDNVYLGIEGGVMGPMNFKHFTPLNAAAGLKLGKNFSPVWGANLEGLAFFGDNRWQTGSLGFSHSHTVVRAINLGLNGTLNFTNLFCEYNPDRRFEVGAEAGIGYWITYGDKHIIQTQNYGDDTELTAKTGLTFAYNLGENRAWQLYAEPAIIWNLTHGPGDAIQFGKQAAQLGLFVGLNYKFKTSNGTHNFKVWNVGELNDEINSLRDQLNAKPKEVVKEVIKEVVKEVPAQQTLCIDNLVFVTFAQGKYNLTNEAKKALDDVKEGRHVQIVGTASPEGPKDLNQRLSQNRADVVAKYLQSRGVIVDEAKGAGVQGVTSNRLAVVYVK
ncbi:OmpA family protein [Prevotella histicola]|uniref:OmpA family protein n=1 Tax=Prevotella histicola TaxID=470565 RepID=UPI001C5E6E44|nr:OmpA family protein [Prevotella histicola]MBW4756494.1 OmpA family protein [Prevotella histicola]